MSLAGYGISGLRAQRQRDERTRQLGQEAIRGQLDVMKTQLASFQSQLDAYAQKHRKDINSNPIFRRDFQRLCSTAGVDPLSSNRSVWSGLGMGDFYYDLAVQIIDVCVSTRSANGGLIRMSDLVSWLNRLRTGSAQKRKVTQVTDDDITRALKKLGTLGSSICIVKIGKDEYVQSVPKAMGGDLSDVMDCADEKGRVLLSQVVEKYKWTKERATNALDTLVSQGVAMIDDQDKCGERVYWFLSMIADVLG